MRDIAMPGATIAGVRARMVVLATLAALMTAALMFVVTLWHSGARGQSATGNTSVSIGTMHPGSVKTFTLAIDALGGARWPVFVVDDTSGHLSAFLGRAQGVKCALVSSSQPHYERMLDAAWDAFEDPCGGALFKIDGGCVDGPCTHSLDRFPITRAGTTASIDLDTLIPGRPGRTAIWALSTG
jgi:hypothetical protein